MSATILNQGLVDVDPLTMHTIVQMQLEDSKELATNSKGKQREDVKTDAQIAMEIYVEDLEQCDAYFQDRKMAQSFAMAILQDGELIAEEFQQEQQLALDRELALHLSNERTPVSRPPEMQNERAMKMQKKTTKDPWEDHEMLEKVAAIYMQTPVEPTSQESAPNDDSDGTVAESSSWAASRKRPNKRPLRICIVCGEERDFFEVARVPCDHEYCRPCLRDLFVLSMRDETLFPPRCDGQEIPLDLVRFFLPPEVANDYELKYDELSTQNRTYCHERSCTAFIPNEWHTGDTALCPDCSKTTCAICKGPSHSGDCPDDEGLQQLIEVANVAQWQRCYQCNRFVELESGCNHMRCKCGADFCYVCGERWKTCACDQWDEQRLYGRAAQIVDRNPNRRLFQPARIAHTQPATRPQTPLSPGVGPSSAPRDQAAKANSSMWESDFSDHSEWEHDWASDGRETPQIGLPALNVLDTRPGTNNASLEAVNRNELIAKAVEHLRNNHECLHDRWRWIRGRYTCEECRHVLKEYIFECRQCHLQACNRCRRNRL